MSADSGVSTVQAATPRAASPSDPGEQLVADLHTAFGKHHARAVHAKGLILEGSFTPSRAAAALSRAIVFAGDAVPVTVRFSDFTGIPDIPDTLDGANPRGFAVKFRSADGSMLDIVAHSFNGFPTATAAEFGVLLRAIGASGPGAAKPNALDQFLAGHPVARTFLMTQKPPPVSYATAAYYGVNAVAFINAQGNSVIVRYRFVPLAGELYLDDADRESKGPNYLSEEIAARLAEGPIAFEWLAQIADAGDNAEDPSIAWPESRKLIKLGSIRIDRMDSAMPAADKSLAFMPGSLPDGIEAADPMLAIRNAAYPVSFRERQ